MIIRIGAAIVDGSFADETVNTPIQTVDTTEGVLVLERPVREKGFEQNITISDVKKTSYDLLRGYVAAETIVAVHFVDELFNVSKAVCNARVVGLELAPVNTSAARIPQLNVEGENNEAAESIYAGSIRIVTV